MGGSNVCPVLQMFYKNIAQVVIHTLRSAHYNIIETQTTCTCTYYTTTLSKCIHYIYHVTYGVHPILFLSHHIWCDSVSAAVEIVIRNAFHRCGWIGSRQRRKSFRCSSSSTPLLPICIGIIVVRYPLVRASAASSEYRVIFLLAASSKPDSKQMVNSMIYINLLKSDQITRSGRRVVGTT